VALLKRLAAAALITVACATGVRAASVRAGDPVPAFTLPDWHGRPAAIHTRRGHVVLIDFWASWCATCRTALPGLDALARRHPALDVIAVSIDAERAAADRFLAERVPDTVMTLLHDADGDLFARFGASGMPALYLIDRDGTVRLAEAGYAPDRLAGVEEAAVKLLGADDRR
jgi:thiol-disulfide isomerase/thioredoxin